MCRRTLVAVMRGICRSRRNSVSSETRCRTLPSSCCCAFMMLPTTHTVAAASQRCRRRECVALTPAASPALHPSVLHTGSDHDGENQGGKDAEAALDEDLNSVAWRDIQQVRFYSKHLCAATEAWVRRERSGQCALNAA